MFRMCGPEGKHCPAQLQYKAGKVYNPCTVFADSAVGGTTETLL